MGVIVTVDEVIEEFKASNMPRIQDLATNQLVIDRLKIEEAITDAELYVFSFLRPVGIEINDIIPATVRELRRTVLDLTRYNFSATVNAAGAKDSQVFIQRDYAVADLKDISSGRKVLTTSKSKKSGFKTIRLDIF